MSIYQFREEDVERFIREHCKGRVKRQGSEVFFEECPYCHSEKDKYKFSINRKTGQFECKRASCGVKGNMITLARDFDFSLGRDVDAYYKTADYSKKQYKTFKDAHRNIDVRSGAIEYLRKRGISEDIVRRYEITSLKDNDKVIVFPFRDVDNTLTFVKYRNSEFVKGETKGNKEWCESNCKPILFGMNRCDTEADMGCLIITEGQIDSLSIAMAGYTNTVSVPMGANGFTWIPYCYDFVNQFKTIVVMGDHENGKITLSEELCKRWRKKIKICKPEDYRDCKDANELLQKHGVPAIRQAISNAEPVLSANIKPLAKVKQVDIMKMEMFSTCIPQLDEVLSGGFRFGQLAILTGKRGEGKSTIASMLGVRAMSQKYNAYFYSGELMDFYFRNWMDCQVTGKFEHSASDHDKLNMWYGDKAFIYDDEIIDKDEDELVTLPESIETAIVQKNCKFILVDNLMTALDDDLSTDLYRNQSKFVGTLAKIAKKYNVFILLICHPRKSLGVLGNDDISGSSNITDKADIVMVYGKNENDGDPNHRILRVTKNRLTGILADREGDEIHLVYDPKSRRVAESTRELFNIRFDWNTDPYGFEQVEDMEMIPF